MSGATYYTELSCFETLLAPTLSGRIVCGLQKLKKCHVTFINTFGKRYKQ